jgi:hypothetical protein
MTTSESPVVFTRTSFEYAICLPPDSCHSALKAVAKFWLYLLSVRMTETRSQPNCSHSATRAPASPRASAGATSVETSGYCSLSLKRGELDAGDTTGTFSPQADTARAMVDDEHRAPHRHMGATSPSSDRIVQ